MSLLDQRYRSPESRGEGRGPRSHPELLRSFRRVLLCGEDVTRLMLPLEILYGAESLLYRYLKLK